MTALCRRLEAEGGPEVLIVLPLKNSGWLEEHTIEALRAESIRRLRAADRFQRLRICCPVVANLDGESVGIHSKILVVDDRIFRVGSSNLTNRSMRLETECDLTIEAATSSQQLAISTLRNRLLGEHLGMSPEAIDGFLSNESSRVRLVDSRTANARALRELPLDNPPIAPVLESGLVDPAQPVTPGVVIEALASSVANQPGKRRWAWMLLGAAIASIGVVALVRRFRATSPPPRSETSAPIACRSPRGHR